MLNLAYIYVYIYMYDTIQTNWDQDPVGTDDSLVKTI